MAPQTVKANDAVMPALEQTIDEDIAISISGQTVTISGAQGQTLEVISLTGRRVMSAKIESPSQRIDLNVPKGCYILKIGKVVRKVTVR
jgi:calcineurin-like phosphoesterase